MNIDKLFRTAWFTPGINGRWGLPLFLIAEPGTSKSAQTESMAEALGLKCHTLIGSIHEPVDLSGLPAVTNGVFKYLPPEWAKELNGTDGTSPGLLFLDELTTCAPAVQAAMLRVLLNGAVGEYKLNPRIRISAAMNPPESAANGYDLSAPMANRGGHIKWPAPTASQWSQWLLGGSGGKPAALDAATLEAEVTKRFPTHFAKAKGLVSAFMSASPGALHRFPKEATQQSGPWASARTWEMATRALAGADMHGMSAADTESFVGSFIGSGTASEFFEFAAKQDLPAAIDVLEGRATWAHSKLRLDKTHTVLASCGALVLETRDETERKRLASGFFKVMQGIIDAGQPDICVASSHLMQKHGLNEVPGGDAVYLALYPTTSALQNRST